MPNIPKADDLVLVKLTMLEAHVIKVLRSIPFGSVEVLITHGAPYKVNIVDSKLLKAEEAQGLIVSQE